MPSKVAVIRTACDTVLPDAQRVMEAAGLREALRPGCATILKNNISWHLMYPGANTTPWQLEGAIRALRAAGLTDLVCVENQTVVTSAAKGEINNKQLPVCQAYDVPIRYKQRTYGTTNIHRWSHGWLLLRMVVFAARKLKFV